MDVKRIAESVAKAKKVRVMVLESWGPFDTGFETFHLSAGSEDEIPFWLAEELEKKGYVKVLDVVTVEDLGKVVFQEREKANVPASLVKLPRDYYVKAEYYIARLERSGKLEDLDAKRKAEQMLGEIRKLRMRKIINLVFLSVSDPRLLDNMTHEELLVFQRLKNIIG